MEGGGAPAANANLSRLNQMGVTFMTLRRRSPV
jgi:hypothetical protein